MKKTKYKFGWTKTYIRTGTTIIEADSAEKAIIKMDKVLGDEEGSLQYLADENEIWLEHE